MLWPFITRQKLLADSKLLGRWGEKKAERYLRRKGLRPVARNYSCRWGEIDRIMAADSGMLVFVEVKTRRSEDYYPAVSAVNHKKREKMKRTAKCFLQAYRLTDRPLRFDIITIVLGLRGRPELVHLEGAFSG